MKPYEELMKENEDMKNQLKTSVSLKMYQDTMDENLELKKRLRKAEIERNRFKYRNDTLERRIKVRKTGKDLSKKAKHEITREVMAPKLTPAELDCMLNNQSKSTKWSNKGIQILHMPLRLYFREIELKNIGPIILFPYTLSPVTFSCHIFLMLL